jgi:hypothetical protein
MILRFRIFGAIGGAVMICLLAATLGLAQRADAAPSFTPQCLDLYSARTDPGNPLMLGVAPGTNPLNGAHLFVDGPAHGDAAGAIARLLGVDTSTPLGLQLPSFAEIESWTNFAQTLIGAPGYAANAGQIQELAKIASEPEVQRISSYSQGGSPVGIYSQTQKLFCHLFLSDPGAVPIINTYFLHASLGACPTAAEINAARPLFESRVGAVAQATGNRPVVFLLETDGIGSSSCMVKLGSLADWLSMIRYEVTTLGALPHAVTYVEAGYSDANTPAYTARALRAVDVAGIRGFYTNDTHLNWTINEIKWGETIVKLLGGGHFIVNTAQNGHGPLVPKNRHKNGNEVLCNPPNRALGPEPTTNTGFPDVDAYLWTSVPGNSGGTCNGGTASGTFDTARAVQLATDANARLGPHDPSKPY